MLLRTSKHSGSKYMSRCWYWTGSDIHIYILFWFKFYKSTQKIKLILDPENTWWYNDKYKLLKTVLCVHAVLF